LTIKIIEGTAPAVHGGLGGEGTPEHRNRGGKTLTDRFAGSVFVKNNPPKIIIILGGNFKLQNN
jgi:hypothetical protein